MSVKTLKALRREIPCLTLQELARLARSFSDEVLVAWAESLGLDEHEKH